MDEVIESINMDYSDKDYDGVLIKTNRQEIKLLISSGQNCCENWGYLTTQDKPTDFVGAEVLEITMTDAGLKTKLLEELEADTECAMTFCTIKTSVGDLQFTAYNSHNGYYSHEVRIQSTQLNETDYV